MKTTALILAKITFFLFCFLLNANSINAETEKISVNFDVKKFSLNLSDLPITKDLTITKYIEKFGNTDKILDRKSGERVYFYEKTGITISTYQEKIKGLTITLNSNGDKNYVQTAFKGVFKFGSVAITTSTVKSDFKKLDGFFTCGMPAMCSSKNKKAAIKVLIGFATSDPAKITQISFILN